MAKYGPKASEKVERALHEQKHGELKSGSTGKPVKSAAQAINAAIVCLITISFFRLRFLTGNSQTNLIRT